MTTSMSNCQLQRSRTLGPEPGGLSSADPDVAGLTIAEFIPPRVMALRQIPNGFPPTS
ncbi:hypothetical protein SAMN05444920_14040 [Nonomuraea solani]|uniref:Uncharacterized protein n=2 Tax=Nonomuraea solani TaxID=1144553 RepID=A0A1H6F3B7_9ACTN|nr:hypothetical protein SAMN05444920_14040 [Nonomuraea solani]